MTGLGAAAAGLDEDLVRAARVWVTDKGSYYASLLFSCPLVAAENLPAASAVDDRHRIYLNPVRVNAMGVARLGTHLIHELHHLLRRHAERARVVEVSESERLRWNVAGDYTINFDLRRQGLDVDPDWVSHEDTGLPPGLTTEDYFHLLGGRDLPDPCCGSGAHGCREPHESADGLPEGVSLVEHELILRHAAAGIVQHARANGPGSVPGELLRIAEDILDPQVPWQQALAALVRSAVAEARGRVDFSRRRPSRRDDGAAPVVLPSLVAPVPSVVVVVDTSGSMSERHLGQALGELRGIFRAVGTRVRVLAVDATVRSCVAAFRPSEVSLVGGGGTDMSVGVEEAARFRPDLLVLLTDGDVPAWPSAPVRGVGRCVVVVLDDGGGRAADGPPWARTLRVPVGAE